MPAKHSMHVALTEPLVRYVRDKVAEGGHASASDVVRLALEAMIKREGSGKPQAHHANQTSGQPLRG